MLPLLWQWMLVGYVATSLAIYQGNSSLSNPDDIGVVRVQLKNDEDNFGSGVVLGNGKCVITAAHVVHGQQASNLKIYKNRVDGTKIVRTATSVEVSQINIHPMYRGTSDQFEDPSAYDFAVVELASVLDASPWKVSTSRGDYYDATLYGWGSISRAPFQYPTDLRSAINKNRDINWWDQCSKWRNIVGAICIMNINNQPTGLNCGGDSGGPAVTSSHVVGVASSINGYCGSQTAGLLAGLSGTNQENFMRSYASKCGFQFSRPSGISNGGLSVEGDEVLLGQSEL